MILWLLGVGAMGVGAPRVSGDDPRGNIWDAMIPACSPRERG